MAWRVELDPAARRELDRLDPPAARRILAFLYDRIIQLDDPRDIGEALRGTGFRGFWKYRVCSYRIVASIEDEALLVLVVRVGHRRNVYQR